MKNRKGQGGAVAATLILTIVVAAGLWFIRPVIHPIVMGIITTPVLAFILILLAVGGIVALKHEGVGSLFGIFAFLVLVVGLVFTSAFAQETMANQVQEELVEIDTLPDNDPSQPRIMPRSVAEKQAADSLSEPRYQLGESDIAISDDGKPYWSMPLSPDGFVNYFSLKQKGASQVDMTTSGKNIRYLDEEMKYGLGMGIFDSLGWQLRKDKYFVNYGDSRVLEHENETYIATPYKTYNYHWKTIIPYTTPEFGGVALTDSEGETAYIQNENIDDSEVLKDQSIYPYDLARYKISSLEYKNGFMNAWFFHKDQLEVAEVPGLGNDQPFTILTKEEGAKLFIAAEPYGNAQGLFQIYLLDAQTGEPKLFQVDREDSMYGAAKATEYVKKANSRVGWATENDQGRLESGFTPTEPLPVIVDDTLYWQVRVVPVESTGIAFTSFVNAENGNVVTTATDTTKMDSQIINFLETGSMEDVEPQPGTGNQTNTGGQPEQGEWEIAIMEDGEVQDTIVVQEGQTFEFRRR